MKKKANPWDTDSEDGLDVSDLDDSEVVVPREKVGARAGMSYIFYFRTDGWCMSMYNYILMSLLSVKNGSCVFNDRQLQLITTTFALLA